MSMGGGRSSLSRNEQRRRREKHSSGHSIQKIYEASVPWSTWDKFWRSSCSRACRLPQGGSIVVKDPEGDFTLRAAIGFSRHEERITAPGGFRVGPITTWVVEHQLPLIVSKPEDSPFGTPFKKNGYQTESFLSIPLTHHGRTLGALHLTNRKDHRAFTHEDLMAFSPIAHATPPGSEQAGALEGTLVRAAGVASRSEESCQSSAAADV
jgi:GAF domain-containing protein